MRERRKIITTGALWSERLAAIDHAAERLYWRVYMASDNYGVISGRAWDVCQKATPGVAGYNRETVQVALDKLVAISLLERWEEEDGTLWVYVVEHDRHQSADFIRKRGIRRSPIPPSLREQVCPKGSKGQGPSPDAVPCPSLPKGTLSTSTSTSISTKTTPPSVKGGEPGGGVPAEPAVPAIIAPTRPEMFTAAIVKIRRELGDLSLDAQSAEAAIRDHRGIELDASWLHENLYRPLPALVVEYGRGPVKAALASLANRPDVSKPERWMRTVAEREAAAPTKPKRVTTYAEREAEASKAAMLAGLAIHTVIPAADEEWSA